MNLVLLFFKRWLIGTLAVLAFEFLMLTISCLFISAIDWSFKCFVVFKEMFIIQEGELTSTLVTFLTIALILGAVLSLGSKVILEEEA